MLATAAQAARQQAGPSGVPCEFMLTTHKPFFLAKTDVPLFVADQNLSGRATLPRALGPWALDSGGFMQLKHADEQRPHTFGSPPGWRFTVLEYLERVARYQDQIGQLKWASPMDYMCEENIRRATGFSTYVHQHLTIENYVQALELWPRAGDGPCPVIPVLQGWAGYEYLRHEEMYKDAGFDLTTFPVVGLGSICRRSNTTSILRIVTELSHLRLHGFGVKRTGLPMYGRMLVSADSAAWSFDARYEPPIEGHTHQHCNNCLEYALNWRAETVASLN